MEGEAAAEKRPTPEVAAVAVAAREVRIWAVEAEVAVMECDLPAGVEAVKLVMASVALIHSAEPRGDNTV